jgi:two-component system cell cycle sensor histidine kinase/response regulator CckA
MDNPNPTPPQKGRILIVDDNEGLREVIGILAQDHGFKAVEAADGLEGMQVLENDSDFAVGIIDVKMPRMNGIALLEELRRKHPTLKVVLISGSEVELAMHAAHKDPHVVVLPKPFTFEALRAAAPELDA